MKDKLIYLNLETYSSLENHINSDRVFHKPYRSFAQIQIHRITVQSISHFLCIPFQDNEKFWLLFLLILHNSQQPLLPK